MSNDILSFDADGAAQEAFGLATREFINNGAAGNAQVQKLAAELTIYSNRFYVRARNMGDAGWLVTIHGADDGCVNEGVTLATCWLESGSFYWES